MKRNLLLALLILLQASFPSAMADGKRLGISLSSDKADCDIITKGETLSPDKGCVFDFCFDDPNHPGKTAGCSQSCPGDPGFPSPDDPEPQPKPDEPEPPREPEPAPEPNTPEPTPDPEPEPPSTPAPVPEPAPEPSSPDGGTPPAPETPPETPGTDGGDFECAENTNCLPPDISNGSGDGSNGPVIGTHGPKKPVTGIGAGHLDCLDPRVHCGAVDIKGKEENISLTPKPVTDSKGKLDCSNPRVSCVSSELKEETPGFYTGCKGNDGTRNPDGVPSITDLLTKSEELFCQQNPLAGKCLVNLELSPTGRYCKENPFSAKCLKHSDGVNPIFGGSDNPISIPVHGASLGSPVCKLFANLARCKKVTPTRIILPGW